MWEKCKKTAEDQNRDILSHLEKDASHIHMEGEISLDAFLDGLRELRKKGGNAPIVLGSADLLKRIQEDALKPENQEKLRRFREEFGHESEEPK